ncbi:uncharacterized protein LOC105444182 [Strongylocentrotus purpuratus]|uniref:Uncharacterized protein n=1 Tax=Strongylocentrotus purpuratus TaxID=7668 RepID=A0A7M7LTJ3_STRPU|nr:uncharacterized protein LOC105444182 [Strongylocentrotus purpuratus]|eukprot:XP_011676406.1 PREDICTED: uncharacterized protein LOC105444182 [Strongylocentrotus purpuratus]
MASLIVRSINFGVVFIGIFAVCSFAVGRKPQTKMNGVHRGPNPTMAITTTTVTMSPHETAAVGQIFSFDKDASPATIFGHVLIPCVLFAVLAVTLYGGLRGTQYLFKGLKKKVHAGRHQTSYKDMRESGDDHDVVMETGGEVV